MTLPYFPQTLPPNTVVGRMSATAGASEAIPFSKLFATFSGLPVIWCGIAAGTANALVLTPPAGITLTNYIAGQVYVFKSGATQNTGATTVAIGGLAAIAIQNNQAACIGGELIPNSEYMLILDSATTAQLIPLFQQTITTQNPFRNRLINGDMLVSQVNGTTAVTPTTTDTYPIDQWKVDATAASKLTFQQVADAPAGFKYSIKISVAAQYAPAATDRFGIYQPIEGINLIDLQLGTAGVKTIATGLWIKGSVPGMYAVGFNNAGTRSIVGTIAVTASWAQAVITFIGDSAGTWANDNTNGGQFYIDLGSGSNYNTTANIWQAGDFTRTASTVSFVNQVNGSTLNITGCQLEAIPTGATVGTAFEFLPYETQLRRSQRYLPCFNSSGTATIISNSGGFYSTAAAQLNIQFSVPTRVQVTSVVYSAVGHFNLGNGGNSVTSAVTVISFSGITSVQSVQLNITGTGTPYTVQQPAMTYFNNASGQLYFLGAQL